MASSFASTASSATVCKADTNLPLSYFRSSSSNLSFCLSPKRIFTKGLPPSRLLCPMVKSQLNEVSFFKCSSFESLFSNTCSFLDMLLGSSFGFKVAVDGSSNTMAAGKAKSEVATEVTKDAKPSSLQSSRVLETQESISEFITQVASLVKLVDSRDIVEFQLKQLDCEVTIRKKEAMLQLPVPAQVTMLHSPSSLVVPPVTPSSTVTTVPTSLTPTPSTSPAVKSSKSSHLPLKCPMAGTFYRSPAPGEPPFVKVGDKVKKGQVLCVIEAMKLMNEIEADQSGTIVDILVDDGKPVSVDTPLFVVKP